MKDILNINAHLKM